LEHLLRTSKELVLEDPTILYEPTISISRVVSSKAVLEKEVGELAQILALSVKAFEARLLDFEHMEKERMEKERMEKEMAHDALEDGIEMEAISPTHSQPLEGYDVLEDEI
jgi:hypothetical protein